MLCSEVCLILEMTMKGVVFWFRLDIQGLGARRDFFCQSMNAKKFAQADHSRSFIRSGLEMPSISGTVTSEEDGICESYPNLT